MNQWKSGFAVKTEARTLAQALVGADVFFGLSAKGAVTQDMVQAMAEKPIIFAMANPDPEITVEDVAAVRSDAIMATGRSDYPNQINNVLGFPYIFRGALDVRARAINMEMKIAAAQALAAAGARGRARRGGGGLRRAAEIRPRLHHSGAVRSAADLVHSAGGGAGGDGLEGRAAADRRHGRLPAAIAHAARSDRRRAAARVRAAAPAAAARGLCRGRGGAGDPRGGELRAPGAGHGAAGRPRSRACATRRWRSASSSAAASRSSTPPCPRATPPTRRISTSGCSAAAFCSATASAWSIRTAIISPSCMVALGDADAMVTGVTRNFSVALEDVRRCIDPKPGHRVIGVSLVLARGRTVLVADTAVTEMPDAADIADDRDRGGAGRALARLRAAACAARLLDLRPSAGRAFAARAGGGAASSTSSASISNTTARWPPTWR